MFEIKGKVNTAICYATVVEEEAVEQIRRMCDYPMSDGAKIRIMPDVHFGKGCTIGTTMTITDKAVPNVVGVDIGCGMEHSDISVTMNVYTHYSYDDAEEELKRLEELRKTQAEVEKQKEKPMSQKQFKVVERGCLSCKNNKNKLTVLI